MSTAGDDEAVQREVKSDPTDTKNDTKDDAKIDTHTDANNDSKKNDTDTDTTKSQAEGTDVKKEEKSAVIVDTEYDMQIQQQEEKIRDDIEKNAFVGALQDIAGLKKEYENNENFLRKIQDVEKKYDGFRRVRGDGSCFYRAYFCGIMMYLSKNEIAMKEFETKISGSLQRLVKQGFCEIAIEDFFAVLMDEIKWVGSSNRSDDDVVEHFNSIDICEAIVTYARFLCSYALQEHPHDYEPFLPEGLSLLEFIKGQVEPTNCEADYLQCVALATEVGVGVAIEYLDQSSGPLNTHEMPHGVTTHVHLLYRPGHYDLLRKKNNK